MASRQVPLGVDLDPLTGAKVVENTPIEGRIRQILIHYPSGPEGNVDVALGHSNTWICPPKPRTYIALDSVSPIFDCDEPVKEGEELWLIALNKDDVNSHKINAVFSIVS